MGLMPSDTEDTYSVLPESNGYRVEKNGRMMSTHSSKSAATSAAKSDADDGDQIIVHGRDGLIDDRMTVGGGMMDMGGGADDMMGGGGFY